MGGTFYNKLAYLNLTKRVSNAFSADAFSSENLEDLSDQLFRFVIDYLLNKLPALNSETDVFMNDKNFDLDATPLTSKKYRFVIATNDSLRQDEINK